GAVDSGLGADEGFVLHGVELVGGEGAVGQAGFDSGAALQPPGGADDFESVHVFKSASGVQFVDEGGEEIVIGLLVFGEDEIVGGEEAVFGGVAAGFRLAFGGGGAVREGCVA